MTSGETASFPARVILSGIAAWAITLIIASATWTVIVGFRGTHEPDEPLSALAFAYTIVMAIPFALTIGVVTTPVVVGMRRLIGEHRLWLTIAGAATAPLAILAMLVTGRMMFGDSGRTLVGHLLMIANDPQALPPVILALIVGGATLGLGIPRRDAVT